METKPPANPTLPYLHRLIVYTSALTNNNSIQTNETDGETCADTLAKLLLEAAAPSMMVQSVPTAFLPRGHQEYDSQDMEDDGSDDEDEEEEENSFPPFKNISRFKSGRPRDYTRVDALRSLLRCMSAIALDVAARASVRVLMDDDGKLRLQALVLLGIWIGEAPQLAPLVSDLFGKNERSSNTTCPLASLEFVVKQLAGETVNEREAREAVVVAEAVRELLHHYCAKRYEGEFVKRWWDWDSSVFVLLRAYGEPTGEPLGSTMMENAADDDAMDVDGDVMEVEDVGKEAAKPFQDLKFYIGGYSPETNAPHCKDWKNPLFQLRWHIARAIGSLFALRSLPLSKFLKRMGVYENDVPFVRHPWTVLDEETHCEVHRMNGVGRVVLPKIENAKVKFGGCYHALTPEAREEETRKQKALEEAEQEANKEYFFDVPTSIDIREVIPMHPSLVHVGKGILLPRRGSVASYVQHYRSSLEENESRKSSHTPSSTCFIPTDTTTRNMSLLGVAMSNDPHPPPILVCGSAGSGKSSLVRELSRQCASFASSSHNSSGKKSCQEDELLELHIDEETDSKTLLGSYVATDIPGEFVWMAGPLTSAARLGRWVLIEDVDRCPEEIQASLIRLLDERILPLGVGKEEKCHPRFRLFGTCGTSASSLNDSNVHNARRRSVLTAGFNGKRVLHPNLWRKVHVDPLPFSELQSVGRQLHPDLPYSVADAVLDVLRKLDRSGRHDAMKPDDVIVSAEQEQTNIDKNLKNILGHGARHVSVRDYIKLLSRISAALNFEPGTEYATESQRLVCLAETVDVFAMSCPHVEKRRDFICQIAAPIWGLTADAAIRYIESRIPSITFGGHNNRRVEIGRGRLLAVKEEDVGLDGDTTPGKRRNFAETNHALRFMESIAVCASANEPALLVGETGCGKTTLVQRLASLTGRQLLVLNLSLSTDSTDLLGGYKPLEIRHVARGVYDSFVDLFVSSFSRTQNAQFLRFVLNAYEKGDWKKLAQCFIKAAGMGEKKVRQGTDLKSIALWADFRQTAERFERQRVASESGMAFLFSEGALVDALRTGKWVLLDEINLASSETLQRLCGLLDDSTGSITLTEKGDAEAVERHPDFRLFAAMNPATDAGKKDLPASIRTRFTELYVDELTDSNQLRFVAARYLDGAVTSNGVPLEHSESVMTAVDTYLQCRVLSEQSLVDGGGQRPRYTMRTLCRALAAARSLIIQQRYSAQRAILEGFELSFEGSLDPPSRSIVQKLFNSSLGKGLTSKERDHPGRRPDGKNGVDTHTLIKPFWMKSGNEEQIDLAEPTSTEGRPQFVLTPSAASNLRRLCQAVASGPWSVLLEGPTSAGKTSLVEYLAKRIGHRCVRINNHEHTDIQEYTGSYAADSNGKISFQEGILVHALRKGYWVILDELNLAPSEVLEALNRLLDDNRELYLAEINEVVKPHPNFRLFATQNPAGAYGGRKPLSRAFRNRFVEIHMADIPENEMTLILERRCGCPPSHAKLLVKVMKSLRQRRSRTGIFRGKDGLVTPRDLLRWAERGATSKLELAREGFMLLAERLRIDEEKDCVRDVLETELKVSIDMEDSYYGSSSEGRVMLEQALGQKSLLSESGLHIDSIAPTKSILRLLSLVMRCIKQKEPVLLVGDTGCGKTTVVQLLSVILKTQLTVVNCHASTETSDLLGGFRPIRGRPSIALEMSQKVTGLIQNWSDTSFDISSIAPSSNEPKVMVEFLNELSGLYLANPKDDPSSTYNEKSDKKRRKLANGDAASSSTERLHRELVQNTLQEVTAMYHKYTSLFEWVDGPLVTSMKDGCMLLLDEMSLAEDAVLERLNSVLEPSRTITLAEKGGEGPACAHEVGTLSLSSEVKADEHFRIFATMNPGGDFGKRELSPALRSRFTEIWVPPVTQRSDVDLVLERSFLSYTNAHDKDLHMLSNLRNLMLNYVEWFNNAICDDPATFCNDFKLSLRDVLSWARFIADVTVKRQIVSTYSAFLHGAALMHLDGVGLGTGVSNHDASATRDKAKSYLLEQIAPRSESLDIVGFKDELSELQESLIDTDVLFGIQPFTIPKGQNAIPTDSKFHMTAPTTGMNLRRVLRGMQISKPILLEGSPGVGKTSLISALAAASGHNLVRINLSEQTDISDLMGSDLPYSSENETDNTSQANFRWCDGVLLQAIKRGDWVLLDELNLASQSVLEGLNSCLDHRASVYIPELGQSFDCPPSFRIFAAQNPLAQGGGRKGLPKSFLNRFTKVYVEALTRDDLLNIVSDQFPTVPIDLVMRMVDINCGIHHDVVQRGLYGQQGSPWEFNLRDVFRWCQLLTAKGEVTPAIAAKYADILYTQRLRTVQDRLLVKERFADLRAGVKIASPSRLIVSESHVIVGTTKIERNQDVFSWLHIPTHESGPNISQSLYGPLEAVACCIQMNWACLLVGSSSCGKNTILKLLGDACNIHVETLAMSPSTDVAELIGCFEQTDSMKVYKEVLSIARQLYNKVCLSQEVDADMMQAVVKNYTVIESSACYESGIEKSLPAMHELLSCFEDIASCHPTFQETTSSEIAFCRQWVALTKRKGGTKETQSPFQWIDGILVKAMERGHWLHLENVNFCPSSVLDRLNPLMEFGGQLVVTECGIADSAKDAKPRVIKPHPNFRLFLSMNPISHGEVSRAMRNRCIEVCVIPPGFVNDTPDSTGNVETVDALAGLWDSGVRSYAVGQCMITSHHSDCVQSLGCHEDVPTIKSLKGWGAMFSSLLKRGSCSPLDTSHQLLYETHEDIGRKHQLEVSSFLGLLSSMSSREHLMLDSFDGDLARYSRLSRVMIRSNQHDLESYIFSMVASDFNHPQSHPEKGQARLLLQSFCRLLEAMCIKDLTKLLTYFDGQCQVISSQIKVMVFLLSLMVPRLPESAITGDENSLMDIVNASLDKSIDAGDISSSFLPVRLHHSTEEAFTYYQLNCANALPHHGKMNVVALSYCINTKRVDASDIHCPITPLLFPLFQTLSMLLQSANTSTGDGSAVLMQVSLRRDRLWQYLKRCNNVGVGSNSQLGNSFGEFLVNYSWLKKATNNIKMLFHNNAAATDSEINLMLRQLHLSFEKVDKMVEESMGGSISSSDFLWKRGGHPILPSTLNNMKVLSKLQEISKQSALTTEDIFGFTHIVSSTSSQVDINNLVAENHPCLYIDKGFTSQLLGAISTIFCAATDETKDQVLPIANNTCGIVASSIAQSFKCQAANFAADLNFATIDKTIKTVENALDLEAIKGLGEGGKTRQSATDFVSNLAIRFGKIQTSQIGEILCVQDEASIIFALSSVLRRHINSKGNSLLEDLRQLRPSIQSFIQKFSSHTQWSVQDIRPYQTLNWVLDSQSLDSESVFRTANCLLPRMISAFHGHHWCNSFNDLELISSNLQGPGLWNKDYESRQSTSISPIFCASSKSALVASCAGPERVNMNAHRSAMFHLLQLPTLASDRSFFTMENGEARRSQASSLLSLFTRCKKWNRESPIDLIKYHFSVVLMAVHQQNGCDATSTIQLLDQPPTFDINTSSLAPAIGAELSDLSAQLIGKIQLLNVTDGGSVTYKQYLAQAWTYLGLVRLHLLVPSSPIDPGRKPAAKVEQLDFVIGDINSTLLSFCLHNGLSEGNFGISQPVQNLLCNQRDAHMTKRSRQEKKIIERPPNSPPFYDLYREIHHFCKTVSVEKVTSIVKLIEKSDGSNFISQETNWQCSAAAFCNRLSTVYSMYEDVTIPCINEIRSIQRGLRELSLIRDQSSYSKSMVEVQNSLLTYPYTNDACSLQLTEDSVTTCLNELLHNFGVTARPGAKAEIASIVKSYHLATLIRLHLRSTLDKTSTGLSYGDLITVNDSLSLIANCSTAHLDRKPNKDDGTKHESEAEREERELREHFPDHGVEFQRILTRLEEEHDDEHATQETGETEQDTTSKQLSDQELSLAVMLHRDLFDKTSKADDKLRTRAFVASYGAASIMSELTNLMPNPKDELQFLGSHTLALALRCDTKRNVWLPSLYSETTRDFHHDPFPSESIKADEPLRNLLIRIAQLLRAFPGHAVLVGLGQVVERIRQLDIQVESLGKVMAGLEVILRRAQDWEQHASQHVQLGNPLKDISALVTSWRKLELHSWSSLLTMREKRRGLRANRHWPRMYSLIHNDRAGGKITNCNVENISVLSPKWVWKGYPRLAERLGLVVETKSIHELAQVLDTFILTSNISECSDRLRLLRSFANELRHECSVTGIERLSLARLMHSMWNYYERLMPILVNKKDKQREPIEKRLKDEVKLAKWDEQTYYSLAESSEKNHRKLMKFLRDYDEVLDSTVMNILEQNFVDGIRASNQTTAVDHEPITVVPGNTSMFPHLTRTEIDETALTAPGIKFDNSKLIMDVIYEDWAAAGLADSVDKYITGISHYNKRMKSVISKGSSWANSGAVIIVDILESLFTRIESLRDPKATKQLKQRALVDLFKVLKDQGLSSMKWSVPSQIRESHQLLQLPTPSLDDAPLAIRESLEKGESYFHRCQVEISRIRSEISMLGSQYMSQREMALMQGYCEHMLFLICQERCMLVDMIETISAFESFLNCYDGVTDNIPTGQLDLSHQTAEFEASIALAIEGFRQLVLLLKESSSLVDTDHQNKVRDAITILAGCAQKLEEGYSPSGGTCPISLDRIYSIGNDMPILLDDSKRDLLSCVELCSDALPSSIFDSCIGNVDYSMMLANSVKLNDEAKLTSAANSKTTTTLQMISNLVQSTLISAQSICSSREAASKDSSPDQLQQENETKVCESHMKMINEWDGLQLSKLNQKIRELSKCLLSLHNNEAPTEPIRSLCTKAAINSFTLVRNVLQLSKCRLQDAAVFYRQHTKLLYVLLRVFRVLIAKGFCADDVSDGGEGDGAGGAGNIKFEDDVEGTGMGEGEGKNDVTDQIENEEQLLGLKGEEEQEAKSSQEKKQLNEDEVDTGMEMEGDFDGENYDLPEQQHDDKNDDEDGNNEEEIDREMGDGNDPNEQVVDEKMWDNNEDDLEDMNQEEEKFEDNSKMTGEKLEDEMRTKEETEDGNDKEGQNKQDAETHDAKQNAPDEAAENNKDDMDDTDNINDDTEDKYEESHGLDVRDEQNGENNEPEDLGIDLNEGLNIDEDQEDAPADQGDECASASEEPDDASDADANNETETDAEANLDTEEAEESEAMDVSGGGNVQNQDDTNEEQPPDDNEEDEEPRMEHSAKNQHETKEQLHGIAAPEGEDAVKETYDADQDDDTGDDGKAEEDAGGADENIGESSQGNSGSGNDGAWQSGQASEQEKGQSNNEADKVPNPFRNPGDAEKFWHKKLDIINDNPDDENPSNQNTGDQEPQQQRDKMDQDGVFEYSKENEENSGQVLGAAEEEQAKLLQENENDEFQPNDQADENGDVEMQDRDEQSKRNKPKSSQSDSKSMPSQEEQAEHRQESSTEKKEEEQDDNMEEVNEPKIQETPISVNAPLSSNKMPSEVSDVEDMDDSDDIQEVEVSTEFNSLDIQEARIRWQTIQSETNNLSRRLCEKLRLVMEPLLATKLRGDYRTGKRVNMKRIIGYIASGYRKDKIWLRRTKPAKRDYRILIAVDDSESMQKSQAGDIALRALATLANGMSQLEIGQLGVASFGEEMKLIHPFNLPFTSESGVNVVSNFTFNQKRTRTALCVESSIAALENVESASSSMQLVFMISDGRIERDSRSKLRRLIRQMSEQNMLMVMIIVEGEDADLSNKGNESILNMKEVSFVKGKPQIKHFIEDYPFPYYLVVNDLTSLPEILGDALRQWFEMMAQIQNGV